MPNITVAIARARVYKNRLSSAAPQAEPSQIAQPVWVFSGALQSGAFVVGAIGSGEIYLRVPGYSHVNTGERALGRPAIRNGKILYVRDDGALVVGDIDESVLTGGSGSAITNTTEVDSGVVHTDAMCYLDADGKWFLLEYDDGGLRIKSQDLGISPLRLYPKKAKRFLHQFNAAIVKDAGAVSAMMTTCSDGILLYRHRITWEHQRIAQDADLSRLDIDGAFDVGGNAFVYGRYRRTDEYDDGKVDYVVLPLIDDVIAMPAFAYAYSDSDMDWPFTVAVNDTQLMLSDFNNTAILPVPEYIRRASYDEIHEGEVAAFSFSLKNNASSGKIDLATGFGKEYDIDVGDAILLEYSKDDGATWRSVELIADGQPVLTYRGSKKYLSVNVAQRGIWLATRSRLPNYVEIHGADTVVDTSPGRRETLYPAPKGRKAFFLNSYAVDTWADFRGYSEQGVIAISESIEKEGPGANPFKFDNGPVGTKKGVEFVLKRRVTTTGPSRVLIYGWSRSDSDTDNVPVFTVKAKVNVGGTTHIITLGTGNFPKTWNGTAQGDYPIVLPLQGNAEVQSIIIVSSSRGDGVTIISNVVIDGDGNDLIVYEDDDSTCSWTDEMDYSGRKVLRTNAINKECGLFATTPYKIAASVDVAASLSLSTGEYPNTMGATKYGIILFATDLRNYIGIIVDATENKIRIERVYRGGRRIIYEHNTNPFNVIANMFVRYEGGKISVYDMGYGAKTIPGTPVFEYEWSYNDGSIQVGEESHVGVYGLVRTRGVQIFAWHESDELITSEVSASNIPASGAIEFSGGRTFKYSNIVGDSMFDGPWQLRNIYWWLPRYSDDGNSGWAVEIQKLDWDGPASEYIGKYAYTSLGHKWRIRDIDEHPYITTGGVKIYLHNRIRLYSDDISGTESVDCATRVLLDGVRLVGGFVDKHGYVSPPEFGTMKTTESVKVSRFFARDRGAATLQDILKRVYAYAGVHLEIKGNKIGSAPLWL